jgi:hypothetical protein
VEELDRILDRHKAQQEQQQLFLDRNVGRNVQKKRHSEYTFSQFRVLPHHQTPPPARAMDLLHKLADDRGLSLLFFFALTHKLRYLHIHFDEYDFYKYYEINNEKIDK